jgi:signal transduction histidine kinase/CheY-like chemotaxis protein/HPt (histidine-containing phosphotransfer) domain-containing protein
MASFMLMIVISIFFMNHIVQSEVAVAAREMLSKTEVSVYSTLRESEVAALSISIDIQNRLDSGQSIDRIGSLMADLNQGMTYPDSKVAGLMSMGGLIQGSFLIDAGRTPPADYRPDERPWYTAARDANGDVAFAGPYTDMMTGNRVVSFSRVLTGAHGEDYGVLFLYMRLDALRAGVTSLLFENGGYGMIADADGRVVIHPNKEFEGVSLGAANVGHAKAADWINANGDTASVSEIINFSERDEISFFQKTSNGWYVGVSFPARSYYGDVILMIAVLLTVGTVLMLILNYLLLRLSMEKMHSEEENAVKSSFLAKMSHEIRTPLNSILGMSELIMRKDISRDIFEYISIIRQAGGSLLAIINDILDFSKIEAGQLELSSEKYNTASLINDVVNIIRVRLLDKPVLFVVKADNNTPEYLIGDEARVRQILLNLLGNAVKFTNTGHIALDIISENTDDANVRLIFRIEDSGIGIKDADMGKLFRDFTRIDASQNRDVEGTGLGLVISRNLCRSMGGEISVTSEYERGSVFTATVLQARGSAGKLAYVDNASEKRVLILEERPICLDALVYAMTSLGLAHTCAQSLAEFNYMLTNDTYNFAFVSSRYAADCMFALGKSKSPIVFVSMVELGEVSSYRDAHSIMTPIFCTGIANILNNEKTFVVNGDNAPRRRFLAPDVKILIVDDIATNLRVAKELMAIYGMDIHTCGSGMEAVKLAKTNRYDIIFMDHMMPDMDGVEAVAAIRAMGGANSYYQKLPIIALTANAASWQREMLLRSGMSGFLAKPIEMHKLDAVLKEWIPEERRREPTSDVSEPSESESLAFPEIAGVSVEAGLRNFGNSAAAYASILLDFCKDADERADRIKSCLAEDDISLYLTFVHALKGAARAVGAKEFAEFAARAEESAQNGNLSAMATMTEELLAALDALTKGIRNALSNRFAAGDGRAIDELCASQLEMLKTALINFDIATVNEHMAEYAGMAFNAEARKELAEIERLILIFEYDAAIKRLDILINAAHRRSA